MRTMLRITMPVDAGNKALKDGMLPKLIQQTTDLLKPEAAYFLADEGKRTAYFVFDMKESSQLPVIAEPWFMNAQACVELMPVMNAQDLKDGLAKALK